MARTPLQVRPATAADLPALVAIGAELREQLLPAGDPAMRVRGTSPATRGLLEPRYVEALADPDRHLVVVVGPDDKPLGMALFCVGSANALLDHAAVHMSHSMVADRYKRRGAGKALVAAAAAFAEERGIEQIVVSVSPGSREANRFFARLGFAPLAVRRVAAVPVVRRRLASPEARTLESVVQRLHRRGGRHSATAAVPLGAAEPEV
jgi:ribosomal protein S18 acetylase RimI-like enzyme